MSWLAVGLLAGLAIAAIVAFVFENGRWRRSFIDQAREHSRERRDLLTRLQAPHMAGALAPTAEEYGMTFDLPSEDEMAAVDKEHIESGRGEMAVDPDLAMLHLRG